ncbi:MAG: hypothetical protein MZV70_39975 [Desulfobacterales bacterium]|nr:hypothetical protein [Desulfobacterales bacterium]
MDDDPSVQRALNRLLSTHGFRVAIHIAAPGSSSINAHRRPPSAAWCSTSHMPGIERAGAAGRAPTAGHPAARRFHHRARHGSDGRAGDEARGGGFPAEALRQPRAAGHRPQGDRVQPGAVQRTAECQDLEQRFQSLSDREREVYGLRRQGAAEQADRRRARDRRKDRQGAPGAGDGKNAGGLPGRAGPSWPKR